MDKIFEPRTSISSLQQLIGCCTPQQEGHVISLRGFEIRFGVADHHSIFGCTAHALQSIRHCGRLPCGRPENLVKTMRNAECMKDRLNFLLRGGSQQHKSLPQVMRLQIFAHTWHPRRINYCLVYQFRKSVSELLNSVWCGGHANPN